MTGSRRAASGLSGAISMRIAFGNTGLVQRMIHLKRSGGGAVSRKLKRQNVLLICQTILAARAILFISLAKAH